MAMRGRAPAGDIGLEVDMDFILKRESAGNKPSGRFRGKYYKVVILWIHK
jgi:hypothetical protein